MAPAPPPADAIDPTALADATAPWLTELRTHPTHHDLLAAFDLLEKTTRNLSQSPAQQSHNLSERAAQQPHHLSERAAHHLDLSERTAHHPDLPERAAQQSPDLPQSPAQQPHRLSERAAHHPDLPQSPADLPRDPVRFIHSTDLALPLAELLAVTPDPEDPTRHLLTTAGPGPCGPASPLPLALADELADDPLALAVLDLFHHRRTLLLCRGLLAADLAGALDTATGSDPWSRHIIALVGLTSAPLSPLEALRLAPLLAAADRSPRALTLALRRLLPALCPGLATPTTLRLEPLADAWTHLADEHHSRLGTPAARLGDTAALGTALRLPSAAARLHLGPLPTTALTALQPGQPTHARLRALLAIFIPEPIALELVVELEDMSLPPCLLGQQTLGRDLFLTPDPTAHRPHQITIPLT